MLIQEKITKLIIEAIQTAQDLGDLPEFDLPDIVVERPKDPTHGDYATPSALGLARHAHMAPLKIAEAIVNNIDDADYLDEITVAPPGFINLRLAEGWLTQQVDEILKRDETFGRIVEKNPQQVQVEFVSANPTGPFVVGSGRNAVIGDTLANVLDAAGYTVQREYYVNDVGTQIDNLAKALYARYAQALDEDVPTFDEYSGDYLIEIGQALAQFHEAEYLASPVMAPLEEGQPDDAVLDILSVMREEALKRIIATIKQDTALIGIQFDRWFSEQSLYDENTYDLVYDKLQNRQMLLEKNGAIWLSSENEADKENVVVRSDGRPTYFASDIAYVWDKLAIRKFDEAIYVWGADHHGHVERLKNAATALGLNADKVTIILYQLVNITRDGVPVRQSKRAGDFITVREVVDEIGSDVFRFMLLTRSADSAMELDLELAKRESKDNPIYYIQYAHARISSIFRRAKEEGATMAGGDVSLLEQPAELALIRHMLRLPELILHAAENRAPHMLAYYAQELATAFHSFYDNDDCRVIVDDDELMAARLKLVKAAQITFANTLRLMGMTVPERM